MTSNSAASARESASEPCTGARIQIESLRFGWGTRDDNLLAIDRLQLGVESVFIEGPSGSGKSTLLSLLGGVILPREGRVSLLGTDLSQLRAGRRDRFRADHVGFVFQLFNLLPYLGILDNVVLPCRFSRLRRERAQAGGGSTLDAARRLLTALDMGDPGLMQRPVTALSIGQQQRVAVARALIGAPEIVIADEPTSALDEGTQGRFMELLFEQCRRARSTLLFVSHDPRLAQRFDRRVSLPALNQACA